jgi:hypothetical protein
VIEEMVEKPVQVIFKGDALQRLAKLRTSYGATSNSQVIRDGLKVLAAIEELKGSDGTITVEKEGKRYKVILP